MSHPGSVQVPQALGNPGSYPPGYVKFAATDPDNECVLPNGHYRVRQLCLGTMSGPAHSFRTGQPLGASAKANTVYLLVSSMLLNDALAASCWMPQLKLHACASVYQDVRPTTAKQAAQAVTTAHKGPQSYTVVCGCMQVLIKVYKALGSDKDYVAFSQRFKAAHPGYRPGKCIVTCTGESA